MQYGNEFLVLTRFPMNLTTGNSCIYHKSDDKAENRKRRNLTTSHSPVFLARELLFLHKTHWNVTSR